MYYKTIDTQDVIDLFHKLMQINQQRQLRILCLEGEPKTGKSHLLSKAFAFIASQQYSARCINLDLRYPALTILDILYTCCRDLGDDHSLFLAAYNEMIKPQDFSIVLEKSVLMGSHISAANYSEVTAMDQKMRILHLTTQLVNDVRKFCDDNQMVVFLIDNVNCADDLTKVWLINTFLGQLVEIHGVRVVLAGHGQPEVSTSCVPFSEKYQLSSITDIEPYITYCKESDEPHSNEAIRVIAVLSDYKPGFFIENLHKLRLASKITKW